jgi:phage-related protein
MLKKITVTNHLGESIELELKKPELSGFFVLGVDGLAPPKASINTTDVLSADGAVYNSARTNPRNIVLSLGFKRSTSISIEEQRHLTYRYFPLKKEVTVVVETDVRTVQIIGYVESNEPNIFSRSQGTVVSIICPNPYFYSVEDVDTIFSGATAGFEFPFSNEDLTDPLISFGDILINSEQTVVYDGDAEVGVLIHIHCLGLVEGLTIYSVTTRQTMELNTDRIAAITGGDIQNGDDIYISTIKGDKYLRLQREGITYNILNALDRNVDWFYLQRGDNLFTYTATTGLSALQFRVTHTLVYEGI